MYMDFEAFFMGVYQNYLFEENIAKGWLALPVIPEVNIGSYFK